MYLSSSHKDVCKEEKKIPGRQDRQELHESFACFVFSDFMVPFEFGNQQVL
jgi:hypothetical protein